MDLRERLIGLVEPVLTGLGYELVDVELALSGPDAAMRVYIDWPDGVAPAGLVTEGDEENRSYEGIGVEDCETVSRALSTLMDESDPIPEAYSLEVSSPGLDRILRTQRHFERFVGERVQVELKVAREGRRRYTGVLERTEESAGNLKIELIVDGEPVEMTLAEIGKARLAPEFAKKRPGKR